ncbi:MAG: hypothetical protein WAV93_02210 [Bacteroidales bacterium]
MNDKTEYPRLTPRDERYNAPDRLLRKPEDLTYDQFDLLAAAWSEGALAGDHLSELEAAMAADPSMKQRGESFRSVRLLPPDDRWPGRNRLIRQSPAATAIRRTLFLTVASAAAVVVLIMFGPSVVNQIIGKTIPATTGTTEMAETLIPVSKPVIISGEKTDVPAGKIAGLNTAAASYDSKSATDGTAGAAVISASSEGEMAVGAALIRRETSAIPVTEHHATGVFPLIADAGDTHIRPVQMNPVAGATQPPAVSEELPAAVKESNWVFRGISALAKAITKEEKKIDGYSVASACVKGINNALGWEMELEQASNKNGEPVAVNFSSSLLSFSAPVNKTLP